MLCPVAIAKRPQSRREENPNQRSRGLNMSESKSRRNPKKERITPFSGVPDEESEESREAYPHASQPEEFRDDFPEFIDFPPNMPKETPYFDDVGVEETNDPPIEPLDDPQSEGFRDGFLDGLDFFPDSSFDPGI